MSNKETSAKPTYEGTYSPNDWMIWPVIILLCAAAVFFGWPLLDYIIQYWRN